MTTITNTLKDGAGTALSGCFITARLKPTGAFVTADGTEVAPSVTTVTNASGEWSLDLYQNSLLTPSGSYWEIEERLPKVNGSNRLWPIEVGASPQTLFASLVSPLPDSPTSNYLTQEAGDARYVQAPGSFATGTAESRPNDAATAGVLTTYSRGDHKHDREISYGTSAARAALTGTDLFEGLRFRETDGTDKLYEYRAAAWLQVQESFVVADAAARTAITTPYVGMEVFQADNGKSYSYTGSVWIETADDGAWETYTPTISGGTAGNGTISGRYRRIGRTIHLQGRLVYGTTSNINTGLVSLPSDAQAAASFLGCGTCAAVDASASFNRTIGAAEINTPVFGQFVHFVATGSNGFSSTTPFTWANTDDLTWSVTYESSS